MNSQVEGHGGNYFLIMYIPGWMLEVTSAEYIYDFCLLMHSVAFILQNIALHFKTRIPMKR
jgi:hypothetical protein